MYILYSAKLRGTKIFTDWPLTNFHGNKFHGSRIPVSHAQFWQLLTLFVLTVATMPCSAACFQIQPLLLRGELHLGS